MTFEVCDATLRRDDINSEDLAAEAALDLGAFTVEGAWVAVVGVLIVVVELGHTSHNPQVKVVSLVKHHGALRNPPGLRHCDPSNPDPGKLSGVKGCDDSDGDDQSTQSMPDTVDARSPR